MRKLIVFGVNWQASPARGRNNSVREHVHVVASWRAVEVDQRECSHEREIGLCGQAAGRQPGRKSLSHGYSVPTTARAVRSGDQGVERQLTSRAPVVLDR